MRCHMCMTKAYSYIRFSSPEQAKGDSLRRQLEAARRWCVERGLELDDTLRDLGRSAFKGRHAQFGALRAFLDLVEQGEVPQGSYLVVESLDRLSREAVLDAAARLFDLIRAGVTVVTLSDGQEYSQERLRADWTPLVISLAVMARAHDESRTKSQRISRAWGQKRRRAVEDRQAMTAICPGWLKLVGGPKSGKYEVIEDRAEIVRSIFADTIEGLGRRTIAKRLNEAKVPTWGVGKKTGSRWHDSYIQKILGNPAALGRFEPLAKLAGGAGGAQTIDGYFPAVVDEQTFFAAQSAAKSRGFGRGRTSDSHRNLLRGIAQCGSCGSGMTIVDCQTASNIDPQSASNIDPHFAPLWSGSTGAAGQGCAAG
ncbi:MAG TPA: recombinase family protein [Pelagibacterium sp.]|nr:recombinase family protein [Pelagibacterium sp.]